MPDLVQRPDGRWAEVAPTHCPIGHEHGPGTHSVGSVPCLAVRSHRTYFCRQPGHDTDESRWQYEPPVTDTCRHDRGMMAPDGELTTP